MKPKIFYTLLALNLLFLTSCKVIGDIFKAGIWVGVIGVFLVVGLIFYVITKLRG